MGPAKQHYRTVLLPPPCSHAVVALAIGGAFYRPEIPRRVWAVGALSAAAPDLAVIGSAFGVAYGDFLGHRGFTHSIFFAAVLAAAIVWIGFRRGVPGLSLGRLR